MFSYRQLQQEQAPWVLRNFGERPAWHPLLGVCEEMGELFAAASREERDDAVADMVIFLSDYATAVGWDMQLVWDSAEQVYPPDEPRTALVACVGHLQHSYLKQQQGIRGSFDYHDKEGQRAASEILAALYRITDGKLLKLVEQTWAHVKQRDWRKNPSNADAEASNA